TGPTRRRRSWRASRPSCKSTWSATASSACPRCDARRRTLMKTVFRLLACGGAVGGPLLAAVYLARGRHGWAGRSSLLTEFVEHQRRADELDDQRAEVVRRGEVMAAAVQEVIAGRLTLREAAACFRAKICDLARENPDFQWETFRRAYAGASDE